MSNQVVATTILRRPSTDITWNPVDKYLGQISDYIKTTYFDTGKAIERRKYPSEDGLELKIVTTWASDEFRDSYTKDPIVREINLNNKRYWNSIGMIATWENVEYNSNNEIVRTDSGTFNDTKHLDELA